MKQLFLKRWAVVIVALCTVPGTLLAQTEKEKEKVKEKTERQQIVITRTGDKSEKTVIEIEGDKVKVNGKDLADLKDVNVHVNNIRLPQGLTIDRNGNNSYNMVWNDRNTRLFTLDSNRAMLGVVTEGDDRGAAIQSITKESGADKAGLKKGDIVTKIDNRKIEETGDITDAVRTHKPGDKVTVTYLRDGKEQKVTAELGQWKGIDVKGMTAPRVLSDDTWTATTAPGFKTYEPASPTTGQRFRIASGFPTTPRVGMGVQDTDDGKGVKVINLADDGSAAKAGIKEDDVITHIDDKAVNSADEISKLMKEKKEQPSVRFQVLRAGKSQNIEVKIPRKLKSVDI